MLEAQTRASCAAGKDCSDEADQHVDGAEEAFFVADLGQLVRRHVTWQRALPRIDPFYAMKCNPNPVVLSVLARLGANFDCASRAEIEAVLSLGVSPDRIIYANPCKSLSHLRYAREMGVRMVTFDNADELHKIQRAHPQAQCVLRILTDDTRSVCQLGLKFGAPLHTTRALIALARDLHLNLVGVSFHVGSGCRDAETFGDAVHRARRVFDEARDYGYEMTLLDCGGGFPGLDPAAGAESSVTFQQVSQILSRAIDEDFPAGSGVRIIGEPGRFYAASAFTLAVNVTARREPIASAGSQSNAPIMYYLNDGVYGSFNCLVFDHAVCHPRLLVKSGQFQPSGSAQQDGPLFECSLWGPTCDSIDCITRSVQLPRLSVGDWLAFDAMGAYTLCAASNFNGFCKSAIQYVNTLGTAGAGDAEDEAKALWQAKVVQ
jgi:ornithine decarboxylase